MMNLSSPVGTVYSVPVGLFGWGKFKKYGKNQRNNDSSGGDGSEGKCLAQRLDVLGVRAWLPFSYVPFLYEHDRF